MELKILSINILQLNILKWYYDENLIFPITAIFKQKSSVCENIRMLLT